MAEFVEAEGKVHVVNPIMGGEFTLCGDAFDLGSDEPGYGWTLARTSTVTCRNCARVVMACRGVRVSEA